MSVAIWHQCLNLLQDEYSAQQFNTWLRPLQVEVQQEHKEHMVLLAPNRFVVDWVKKHFYPRIQELVIQVSSNVVQQVNLEIGSKEKNTPSPGVVEHKNHNKDHSFL